MTVIIKRGLALWLAVMLSLLAPLSGLAEGQWIDADAGDVEIMAEAVGETDLEAELADLSDAPEDAPEASDEGTDADGQAGDGDLSDEAPETPEPVIPALAQTSLELGVGEKYTLSLEGGISFDSVGAVFSSSKPKVVSVDRSTGEVKAREKGSAKITMKAADGSVSVCKVKVRKAPSKVTLSSKKLTLGVGEETDLKARLPRKTASGKIRFSSSDKSVVTVNGSGHIVALKKGKAKITVKTFNKKKAVCMVTVKAAPRDVSLENSAVCMWNGDSMTVTPRLSRNSAGAYVLSSSDESVVAVSGSKLQAKEVGSSTVTVTTYNGRTAQMTVEVCRRPVYRALLIGETTFPGTKMGDLPAAKDVSLMKKMLKSTQGAAKSKWKVTARTNRTSDEICSDIRKAFAGAQEGDVSLFYISTHGDDAQSFDGGFSEYAGFLMTYPNDDYTAYYERNTLTLVRLASWLKEVPGQVVVIIDSCGSGAAVYNSGEDSGNAAANGNGKGALADFSPEAFDRAVVSAFEAEDKGVMAPGVDEGAFVIRNKFYVLTAAAYQEACWTKGDKYSYFTKWLTDGVKTKGSMPADTDKNKLTTLNELYRYIRKRGNKQQIESKGVKYKQHVQVYPSNSGLELFYRK